MRDTFNEINITPLTDIFLVLLIIMMVVAPLLDQQGLNLAVPEIVKSENINTNAKIMTFTVTSENKYFFEGEEVRVEDLDQMISSKVKNYPDGLMIQTEGDSSHGCVVKLMDSARNSGVTSISLSEI